MSSHLTSDLTDPIRNKISCIIPTFNRGLILLETLDMLGSQSHPAWEIIVVDQSINHPDNIKYALDQLASKGEIIYIYQPEPNASKARNRGALEASGDILVFLDDDISITPDFIKNYIFAFSSDEVHGVAGQVLEGKSETVSELSPEAFDPLIGWLFCKRNYDKPMQGRFVMAGNMGVRRADFFAVGGMDERYYRGAFREEADFAMRWSRHGFIFHYMPSVSLYHRASPALSYGGQRHWTCNKPWVGYHHYFGQWYFLLCHGHPRLLPRLIADHLRAAGFNKKSLLTPWWLPVHTSRWLVMFPKALWCRIAGPKLIRKKVA